MKKHLGLFFFGLFITAAGIGCFSATFNNSEIKEVEAATDYLKFEDGVATLGRYPQSIVKEDVATIQYNGTYDAAKEWYSYENKEYAIINVSADRSDATFNDGSLARDVANTERAFLVEDLKWEVLSYGDGYADLISTRIIDRQIFDSLSRENYLESSIFTFNNTKFLYSAFTKDEIKYLQSFEKENAYYVNLPEESQLKDYKDEKLEYPSDYAISSTLSGNTDAGGKPYINGPFWTKTITIEGDRVKAFWSKQHTTNCAVSDNKIGLRPVIRVAYKGAGGGSSSSKKTNTGSINVTLALGITLTVVGAGGLIAFFVVWGKKHPTGKPPVWIIITIAGTLVVSIVGLSCLASGISGGGGSAGCFNYGYYVQTGQHSGNGIVQVGHSAWLIKSDGTAYYCSALKDAENASDFAPDNYMTGTYKISGSKLTITVPKREIQNFGPIGGTFNFTIKNCKYLYSGSVETYHWVRGE